MRKSPETEQFNVAVLMGGVSEERPVSLKSGRAVAVALRARGHRVAEIDLRRRTIEPVLDAHPDLAFIALHGEFGEDGQVQALLDEAGIPYTGSTAHASRIGMDKKASKRAFLRSAVATPPYSVITPDLPLDRAVRLGEAIGFPLVCKPPLGGSSIDVSIAGNRDELHATIESWNNAAPSRQLHHGDGGADPHDELMLEKYIHGRELTVSILGDELLPVVEIITQSRFFDYRAKYEDEKTEYHVPVTLIESMYWKVCDAARRAYRAVGCRHMGRVDLICGFDGGVYVLEINTIPGLTSRSLLPMAARSRGIEFPELCERLCRLAADSVHLAQPIAIPRRKSA